MKKKILALAAIALAVFASCEQENQPDTIKSVTVKPSELTIQEGDTKTLEIEVEPAGAAYSSVVWTTDNDAVAKISKKGLLSAVSKGNTTVYAIVDGVRGECKVTVTETAVKVTGVSLDKKNLVIGLNEIVELTATVLPEGATVNTVKWSSSNESIATVDEYGIVCGVGGGKAVITVKTDDGGFEDSCEVSVIENVVAGISFLGYSEEARIVEGGTSETVTIEFTPKNATDKELEWTSSNSSVATVESAGEGMAKVTFSKNTTGAVVITATSKSNKEATASQSYFVKGDAPLYIKPEGTVYAGKKAGYSFNAAVYNDVSDVKWTTGDKEVSGLDVMLAADKAGENVITFTASFGDVIVKESFTVNAEDLYMELLLPEALGSCNTTPVFSPDGTKSYIITQNSKRCLIGIDLESRKLDWIYEIPASETAANNGGQLAVNPQTGDIVLPTSSRVYCISANGDLKWKSEQLESNTSRNPTMYSGCGAAFSNDCSVVFMCCTPRGLYAFDMSDGSVIDKVTSWKIDSETYNPESNQAQLAVYGDNNICLHLKSDLILFYAFDGSRFAEQKRVRTTVAEKYTTDLTSCAVTRDQKTVFFNGYSVFPVDLQNQSASVGVQDGTKWHMSPAITEDGYMYQAQSGYTGGTAAVLYYNINAALASGKCVYKNSVSGEDGLKFTSVACDAESNAYFAFWDKTSHFISFFKSVKGGQAEVISSVDIRIDGASDFYQGAFNFGNGYLIAVTGGVSGGTKYPGKVIVRCIDAQRGKSWSGFGGDICATKNANLVYSK